MSRPDYSLDWRLSPILAERLAVLAGWLYTCRMVEAIHLSRGKLAAFQACQRRFYLRYQQRLAWPAPPVDPATAVALQHGAQFHQLLQRYFLQLPIEPELIAEGKVADWWQIFQRQGPVLPDGRQNDGRHFAELTLTVPVGDCLLTGRFDLLHLQPGRGHIYDWKTERQPRPAAALRQDLQTRLYLALLYLGSDALGASLAAEQIQLTYWYVQQPAAAVTFTYAEQWHAENWTYLTDLATAVTAAQQADQWPLTDDLAECRRCAYAAYCGREGADQAVPDWEIDPDEERPEIPLLPA
jgi:hypothetical protein